MFLNFLQWNKLKYHEWELWLLFSKDGYYKITINSNLILTIHRNYNVENIDGFALMGSDNFPIIHNLK